MPNIDPLEDPDDQFVSLKQFPPELPKEPKTIKDWMADPRIGFPKPYEFGPRYKRWSLKTIRNWQRTRRAAS
jgi:predicted DNA-binding transcriptional regulator AlpA